MNPDHPSFEDLSAHYDGEAPEWAEHVAGCASCTSRLGELTTLTDTIAQAPPGRVSGDAPDDPVARALASAGTAFGHGTGQGGGTRSGDHVRKGEQRRRWVLAASTAAVVVVSIAIGAVVASKGPHRQMTRDALAPSTPERSDRATGGGVDTAADAVVVGGDLGMIPDRAALVKRVAADLRADGQRRSATTPDSSGPVPAQGVVGTRPCEVEARGDPGDRGEVVYQATAEEAGMSAVVLAFRSVQGPDSVTVELRARSDCRLLFQGAIP